MKDQKFKNTLISVFIFQMTMGWCQPKAKKKLVTCEASYFNINKISL